MQIDPTNHVPPVPERIRKSADSAGDTRDAATFDGIQSLKLRLAQTSDVRPEAVARARALIADRSYPPETTIRGIAALLAATADPQSE